MGGKEIKFVIGSSPDGLQYLLASHDSSKMTFVLPGLIGLTQEPFPGVTTIRNNEELLELKNKFCEFIDQVIEAECDTEEHLFEQRVKREVAKRLREAPNQKSLFKKIFG